jgi:hypothetical protein
MPSGGTSGGPSPEKVSWLGLLVEALPGPPLKKEIASPLDDLDLPDDLDLGGLD